MLSAGKFGAHRVTKRPSERDGHVGLGIAFAFCPVQRVAVAVSPRLLHQRLHQRQAPGELSADEDAVHSRGGLRNRLPLVVT